MLADPVMGDNGPATPAPDNSQRQRVLMALMQQRGMGQPQGGGIFGGLNTALQNGMMMYGMRKPQPMARPMGMAPAPDPVMGQGTGMAADPSAYDYLRPKG